MTAGAFIGWYASPCCGWRRTGGRCTHGAEYVPVMKPAEPVERQAAEFNP